MKLSVGFSPCPNDTFIFHGLVSGTVEVPGCRIEAHLHDVETLNTMAFDQSLDVTKLSIYAWLGTRDNYRLLNSGGALGYGCGPVVIAKPATVGKAPKTCRVALPGRWTTAHLLFRLWGPDFENRFFTTYDRIFELLKSGQADYGVIIHESRFTFQEQGFVPVVDLGAWWETQTGLPIPLGCIAAHRRLPDSIVAGTDRAIRESIASARSASSAALPFIRRYAQEMTETVLNAHIDTFVNDFSLDLGQQGRAAIEALGQRAQQAGILT